MGPPAMTATRIDVTPSDGSQPYQVVVGVGVLSELPGLVPEGARTVVVIHAEGLGEIARPACGALPRPATRCTPSRCPTARRARRSGRRRAVVPVRRHDMTRSDCIVGIGGGATTDLAGFAAATWLRGVRVVLVPTTLLGMVDAAVGGKTAIDIPEGKNLVGAFHPPAGVLADLVTLETLPRGDYVSGLAEIIKAGFIADPRILDLVEADPEGAAIPRRPCARADRARDRGQGPVVSRTWGGGPPGVPELRAHARPCHRTGGGVPVPARLRGGRRDGLRRRARPAAGRLEHRGRPAPSS